MSNLEKFMIFIFIICLLFIGFLGKYDRYEGIKLTGTDEVNIFGVNGKDSFGKIVQLDKSNELTLIKECSIINIINGDTFDLKCGNIIINNNKLVGINMIPKSNIDECYNAEDKKDLSNLLKGKIVDILFLGQKGKSCVNNICENDIIIYDNKTQENINKLVIKSGFGYITSLISNKLNKSEINNYEALSDNAKNNNKGLWGKCKISKTTDTHGVDYYGISKK